MPTLEQALSQITTLQQEMAVLRAQIEWFKRQLFGGGKGERLDRAQLLLEIDTLEKLAARIEAPVQKVSYERSAPTKRPLASEAFAKLPVQETVVIVPEEVKAQPEAYEEIGEERTFEIEIVPPKLFRREIVRPKFKHKTDRAQPPLLAPAPARPVTGGYASAGLLAWVTTAKYVDHLPLFRQEKMLARWGAPIARQTLSDWIAQTSCWLEPLHRLMHAELLKGGYVQFDETRSTATTPIIPAARPPPAGCGCSVAPAAMPSSSGG
ncbi:MAG: transposase [Opitutaceae bacterium]|nr:transposase [Opitutaceae bacterium]